MNYMIINVFTAHPGGVWMIFFTFNVMNAEPGRKHNMTSIDVTSFHLQSKEHINNKSDKNLIFQMKKVRVY